MFARKIIRVTGRDGRSEIENEARVVSSLLERGGHANIVGILNHDWLKMSLCYFIDMELCDANLREYIDHHYGTSVRAIDDLDTRTSFNPVFVNKGSSLVVRMQNMWTIGTHVARGLEFMHARGYVHRDLKPSNGIPSQSRLFI